MADCLRADIDAGRLAVGARLPSYRSLMGEHGVALNTAQAAVRQLEQEGRVVVRETRGAFVVDRSSPPAPETELRAVRSELCELRDGLRSAGAGVAELEQRVSALVDRLDGVSR